MFINRDLSYPYLTSTGDLCERFFWKRLCINVLFGNIDRNIRQVFLWGINTLTFPPKVWGAEPTPPSPPSREGSGGGGWGPTPHCRVIYSYILFTQKSTASVIFGEYFYTQKSAALPSFGKSGKRAPQCRVFENGIFSKIFFLKRAPHCGVVERGRVGCGPQCRVLENEAFLNIYILKKVPHCHVLENRLGFRLCTYLTFLRVIRSEFKAWQHLIWETFCFLDTKRLFVQEIR